MNKYLSAVSQNEEIEVNFAGRLVNLSKYKGVRGAIYYFDHCYTDSPAFDVYNKDFNKIATRVSYAGLI